MTPQSLYLRKLKYLYIMVLKNLLPKIVNNSFTTISQESLLAKGHVKCYYDRNSINGKKLLKLDEDKKMIDKKIRELLIFLHLSLHTSLLIIKDIMFEKVSKSFYRTPLHKLNYELFSKLNINLYIKRDDLYPISGGGNKGRKLEYIINNKAKKKYNALVTTGGSQSNHIRASLIRAKELGWKSHIIIHDHKPQVEEAGNLKLTKLMADKVTYVDIKDVAVSMDNAISELKREGYNPMYIWGGGHCLEGTLAYHNAVIELSSQLKKFSPNIFF